METFVVISSIVSVVIALVGYFWPKLVRVFAFRLMNEVRVAMRDTVVLASAPRKRTEALETLMEAIEETPIITIQLANVLFHKRKVGSEVEVFTWNLNSDQKRKLSQDPSLLQDLDRLKLELELSTD